ncbi:uncharacterized protein LOC128559544 [Mercenaria mercenaria]|uniref:uncharacterized protein LOC128559544 n=1 Tax=Mercenaria mercenaria TaxID=6596 RepID=UPI00234E5D2A|nr:uncharacterized protein LOC128559544 [Mercenaria mercenaria]
MRNYFCILLVTAGIQLIYAQQLQKVPRNLSALAAKLHHDPDIQTKIYRLSRDDQQVANSFNRTLEADGSKIHTEKNRLVNTSNPTDVKVDTLRKTLKAMRDSVTSLQRYIITLEKDYHSSIEAVNGRKKQHDTNIQTTKQTLETIQTEISSLEHLIKALDESIGTIEQISRDCESRGTLEQSSRYLDIQAKNLRSAARQKRDNGIFGGVTSGVIGDVIDEIGRVIGGIFGVALVPYTGGASLEIATAATGNHVGVNLIVTDDCNINARRIREKRQQAQTVRTKQESQIKTLQTSSDKLQQAADGLQGASSYLCSSLDVYNDLLRALRNMDTALKDTELQSNSFVIIQNAFARYPEALGAKSQHYLDKLKEKWVMLEKIFVQHGAKASLT